MPCYKGALFLVAGAIDHETGTRDITALAGLRRAMPITALAGGAAALSMAGVPLTLGFVGKDGAYEALLHAGEWSPWLLALMVLASILLGLAGLLAGVLPFRGHRPSNERSRPGVAAVAPAARPRDRAVPGGRRSVDPQRTALGCGRRDPEHAVRRVAGRLARAHAGVDAQRAHAGGVGAAYMRARSRADPHVAARTRNRAAVHRRARRR